jgi:hypothetical protein
MKNCRPSFTVGLNVSKTSLMQMKAIDRGKHFDQNHFISGQLLSRHWMGDQFPTPVPRAISLSILPHWLAPACRGLLHFQKTCFRFCPWDTGEVAARDSPDSPPSEGRERRTHNDEFKADTSFQSNEVIHLWLSIPNLIGLPLIVVLLTLQLFVILSSFSVHSFWPSSHIADDKKQISVQVWVHKERLWFNQGIVLDPNSHFPGGGWKCQ